jgi:hypothetical protein
MPGSCAPAHGGGVNREPVPATSALASLDYTFPLPGMTITDS